MTGAAQISPADLFRSVTSCAVYEIAAMPIEDGGLYMLRRSDDPQRVCWEPADALLDPSRFRRIDRRLTEAAHETVSTDDECNAQSPRGYLCTIRRAHPGDHVAHEETEDGSRHVIDTWPRAQTIHEEPTTDGEAEEPIAEVDIAIPSTCYEHGDTRTEGCLTCITLAIEDDHLDPIKLSRMLHEAVTESAHRAQECGDLRVQVEKLSRDLVQLGSGDLRAEIEAVREILCASPSETTEDAARSMLHAFRGVDSEIEAIRAALGAKENERTIQAVARVLSAAAKARAA